MLSKLISSSRGYFEESFVNKPYSVITLLNIETAAEDYKRYFPDRKMREIRIERSESRLKRLKKEKKEHPSRIRLNTVITKEKRRLKILSSREVLFKSSYWFLKQAAFDILKEDGITIHEKPIEYEYYIKCIRELIKRVEVRKLTEKEEIGMLNLEVK